MTAERFSPFEFGQTAGLGKRGGADDGVVAPVIGAVAGPCGQAARDDRAIHAAGELLQAAEKRPCSDQLRSGLKQSERRVLAHHLRQPQKRGGVDQAVGVEQDHVVVAAAPAPDEVLHIAGFARDVAPASPIPHRHDLGEGPAQRIDRRRFADPSVGVGRIRQHHDLEAAIRIDRRKPFGHGLQGRGGAHRVLVVDRHDQRRQCAAGPGRRVRHRITAFRCAGDDRAGGKGYPTEGYREEEYHQPLQQRHAGESHHLQHLVDAVDGDAEAHGDQDESRERDRGGGSNPGAPRRRAPQILGGHAQWRLRRHAAGRSPFIYGDRGTHGEVHR